MWNTCYLVSESKYHKAKWLSEILLAIEMNKTKVAVYKPVYLGLMILGISKLVMYEYWYNNPRPAYGERVKLC